MEVHQSMVEMPRLKRKTSCSPMMLQEPQPKRHRQAMVDDYSFKERISVGGQGQVWQAICNETKKEVAIKVQPLQGGLSQEVEHHKSASSHPSVVGLKEVIRSHGALYMVMERLKHDLRFLMDDSPWPIKEEPARGMMLDLIKGLAHFHKLGIVHRDIKPGNLLVTPEESIKICDFGVACRLEEAYYPTGTMPYCAPEMFLQSKYTEAVDVWAAGCVFYELVFKKVLFDEDDEIQLLNLIFGTLGKPDSSAWPEFYEHPLVKEGELDLEAMREEKDIRLRDKFPHSQLSPLGFDLLTRLLATNPRERISAAQALAHPWFQD